jgi:hypothetical protein
MGNKMQTISMGDRVRDTRPEFESREGIVLDVALLTVEIEAKIRTDLDEDIEAGRVIETFSVCWGLDTLQGVGSVRGDVAQRDDLLLVAKFADIA